MTLCKSEDYEYRIKNEENRKEMCEKALENISYNGEFRQNSFFIRRSKLEDTINCWQNSFPELREQLKGWRKSDVGSKFTSKEILSPLRRGKKIKFVFLKIYDRGEGEDTEDTEDTLRCVSISGEVSIKVKVMDRMFGLKRWIGENIKEHTRLIKSHPEIMAALIMSRGKNLNVLWE
ncbi:hypothetical protein RhiirC2_731369 [Rhizophagus irregularis]|uniref:Uncharacterized protein n=1 Tax=Rhizophagus irregularis TaxID=588596 RepID=A0A2N1NV19_9GLOM|nr:hypothetical protein RhiirC2_731369 [Rhizophagus irregularis]